MATLPLFPLGTVLMPGARLPLRVFEPRYLTMLRDLIVDPDDVQPFGVVAIRSGIEVGVDQATDLYPIGCTAALDQLAPIGADQYALVAMGERRFRVESIDTEATTPYLTATVSWLDEPDGDPSRLDSAASQVRRLLQGYWRALGVNDLDVNDLEDDAHALSYQVDQVMVLDVSDRFQLLASTTTEARLSLAIRLLTRERELVSKLGTVPLRPDREAPNLN